MIHSPPSLSQSLSSTSLGWLSPAPLSGDPAHGFLFSRLARSASVQTCNHFCISTGPSIAPPTFDCVVDAQQK